MGEISPAQLNKPKVKTRTEPVNEQFTFIVGPNESAHVISIASHESPAGITIGADGWSGVYDYDVIFPIPKNSTSYFDVATNQIVVVDDISKVPKGNKLVKFNSPTQYKKTFSFTVQLDYIVNNTPPVPVTKTKTFKQVLYNNWDVHRASVKGYK